MTELSDLGPPPRFEPTEIPPVANEKPDAQLQPLLRVANGRDAKATEDAPLLREKAFQVNENQAGVQRAFLKGTNPGEAFLVINRGGDTERIHWRNLHGKMVCTSSAYSLDQDLTALLPEDATHVRRSLGLIENTSRNERRKNIDASSQKVMLAIAAVSALTFALLKGCEGSTDENQPTQQNTGAIASPK